MLKKSSGSHAFTQRSGELSGAAQSTQAMAIEMRSQLQTCLSGLMQGAWPVHLPAPPLEWASEEIGHFHLSPQLFVQVAGWTHFRFPHSEVMLEAGALLLVPERLLHVETVGSDATGAPFRNIVISSENGWMSSHLGYEAHAGTPDMLYLEGLQHPKAARVQELLSDVTAGDTSNSALEDADVRQLHTRALLAAALTCVLRILDDVNDDSIEHPLIAKVRALVQNQFGNHQLSVRWLASQSGCSARYLSTMFYRITGEHLVTYMNRQRMTRAVTLLKESQLSGKEVAWACGFSTHSYFIRIFREHFNMSPQAWRAEQ